MFQMKKEAFSVLGKEGSTQQGPGFIQALWEDANGHFAQIAHLAKRDGQGNLLGVWGAMTDMSRSFLPWEENFQKGLYLAGVECEDTAQPPAGARSEPPHVVGDVPPAGGAAMCSAVGNVSLEDWERFTASLGCRRMSSAHSAPQRSTAIWLPRLASTSFMFMFDWVPDPVCQTLRGNSPSCWP